MLISDMTIRSIAVSFIAYSVVQITVNQMIITFICWLSTCQFCSYSSNTQIYIYNLHSNCKI